MNISESALKLARRAVETYCRENRIIKPPEHLPERLLEEQSGVFVTLEKEGELRGCIGTFKPTRENIAREIIYNAVGAAFRDPRFLAVRESELDSLVYTVSLLSEPENIDSTDQLDP
ncbi:MAG: AmmeMemoRadiSam system protein A, partial [bacterium]